jgi:hypothetical protein
MTVDEVIELMQELKSKGTKHIIIGVWTADLFEVEDNDAWGEVAKHIDETAYDLWDGVFTDLQFAVDSADNDTLIRTGDEE